MFRTSSCNQSSNFCSYDVSNACTISLCATTVSIFSNAGKFILQPLKYLWPYFEPMKSHSAVLMKWENNVLDVHLKKDEIPMVSLNLSIKWVAVAVAIWQTNSLMGEAIPPAFLPNPQQMPTYVLLDAIQYWGLKVYGQC